MKPYQNKSILIIGAGLLQVEAIKIANQLGLTTVVTDYNENAPGMKIADYPIVMSIRDIDGTVRVIKEFNEKVKIDGVITVGTDASMTVAAVANALHLPGIKFESAEAASHKLKMRERLEKHQVPIPRFFNCWCLEDLKNIASILQYPLVIKPVDNMGARGVMKIENEVMLESAFYNAKSGSPSGELIVEEYMQGQELSIDALVYKNQIYITGVADRIIEREPYFIELGHVMPSNLPKEKIENAIDVFKMGIRALGIDLGAAKGDIKVTKEGAKIVEIAARLSGGFMSAYTYPYATGVNLIHNAIDIALGYPPHNLVPTKNWVSIEKAIIPAPGIVEKVIGVDEAYAIPGVKDVFIKVKEGDEIKNPKSNVEKAGNIIVAKNTRDEAWNTMIEAEKCIQVVTAQDKVISWNEITRKAKERFNRTCFVCKICDGIECRGKIPGMGGIGTGKAFIRNYRDLSRILLKTKTIHSANHPDISTDFLGVTLSLPIAAAPITGCDVNMGGNISELEYACSVIDGCKASGIIGFVGDGAQPDLYKIGIEACKNAGGFGGAIFKPRANQFDILKRLKSAMQEDLKFVGIDIDAASFVTMDLFGQKVEPKTLEQLTELIQSTPLPFIIKGILTVEDAENAVKAGAAAIVISNHGGRITENHPSSISVLNEIARSVKHKTKIIFDGGVRSGEDIYKSLALGADLVMIGRPFAIAAMGGGKEGVQLLVKQYKEQFEKIMLLTGTDTVKDINEELLIMPKDFDENNYKLDSYLAEKMV